MNLQKFCLFSLVFFSYQLSFGQFVQGKVLDAETAETLVGATVVSHGGDAVVTDNDGFFRLKSEKGKLQLTIAFIGYQSLTTDSLDASETIHLFLLKPTAQSLGEVVVSAGKFEQRMEELTVSLDVIKPELVQEKNQIRIEESLQQAPGVNVTDGSANIRSGSGWSYGTGTRVQTLVDGIPLISGDAGQAQWDLVPIHSLQQIEVIKGASSVLYGSAALNGIINAISLPMPQKRTFNASMFSGFYTAPKRKELQWWDGTQIQSGANFSWQEKLSAQTGLVLSGGFYSDEGFRYLDKEERSRVFAKYFFNPAKVKGLKLQLAGHFTYADNGDALLWQNDSLGYIPRDSAITRSTGWDFFIDPTIIYQKRKLKHTLQGRYLRLNNDSKSKDQDYSNHSDQYVGQYLLQHFPGTKLTVSTGYSLSQTQSSSVVFQGKHTATNHAVFLQTDYKPLKWLNLNGGFRYEGYQLDDRNQSKPVFRAGLNAQIIKGLNARASYGQGFRFPAASEAYTKTSFGGLLVHPNPDLKAETGYSLEAGLRKSFKKKKLKGYIDASIFEMRFNNMIEFTFANWGKPFTFDEIGFKPINVGKTKITGVELALAMEGEFSKDLKFRFLGGYTYALPLVLDSNLVFAKDNNGSELSYVTSSSNSKNGVLKYRYQHLAKADMQVFYKRINAGISVRYNDFMENIDALFNDQIAGIKENRLRNDQGDFVLDLRAGYYLTKKLFVTLAVNNVTNREVMIRPGFLAAPTLYTLKLSYGF